MEKIALLPGGFKPPHAGHYNMAKWLAVNTDADTVIVKVGAKEREGITREMSLKLWDLYRSTDSDPSSTKLSIIPSKHNSPVKDVYDFIENDAPEGSTIYLAMGEKEMKTNDQRFANIHKFSEPRNINFETKLVPPQAGGVSGTDMRDFIKSNDQYSFFEFIPDHLTSEQKEQAWQIVTTKEVSDWKPGDPVSFEMWTSDWNLKGFGKEYDSNFKHREDAVAHFKPNKAEDWAFKSYAYVAKKIPGFGGDLDEDLYNPEDKVLDYMRSSEWKAGMPDGPKDDIPRTKDQIHNRQRNPHAHMSENKYNPTEIPLEIMNTPELQIQGMMGRDSLEGGMLFPYEEVGERSFHMKNCLIPLDIVFTAQDEITNIHPNCPPCLEDNCPQYTGIADNVLELPGGYCQQNNINIGDYIPRSGNRIHNRQIAPISWEESVNESRGGKPELHIYDFDETIARVETPIPYTVESPEGKIIEKGETSSIEFEKTKDHLKDSHGENIKINWDFKAFANLISKGTLNNEVFQKLLKSIKNPNAKVTILTARAIGLPVTKFLKDQGIWAYVVPLGLNKEKGQPVTGEDKANWIENRIKDTTKKVLFIDDSSENRKAIYTLRDKYPNIEFDVENPLKIKLNELSDREIKFFATHADILKQLNTSNFKLRFIELQQELEGERLEALEYFWDEYFSNLEDSCEIEKSFDKKVNETKYGAHDLISQYKDQIQSNYGHQQYRDLQLMISQQKDEEVGEWINNAKKLGKLEEPKPYPHKAIKPSFRGKAVSEASTFSKDWWKEQLTEIITETKANTHLTHLEELILTQGQDGFNQAKNFLYELIKNLKGEDNTIKNVSVKWDGAPAIFTGINPDNGQFFVGTKSVFNVNPKINYTPKDIDENHGHAAGLAKKLKLALQYLPSVGIKGILQGDFMFDSDDVETDDIEGVTHYTFKPNTIKYAVEANSELGKQIISADIGIIFHTTYKDLSGGGASFGADVSGLSKQSNVWFDDAYFKDDTGILLNSEEEKFVLEKITKADSINIDYTNLPLKALNTYLNSEVRQGEFVSDPYKSFERFKNWYQLAVNKSIEKVKRPETKEAKRLAGELKIKEFESQKENIINIFNVSKLLSQAKSIFITKYDDAVATKHFIDNGDGTLSVTKAEGFVAVDHTENGIKLVDRLEFSKNNFNAGKPGAKK